MAAKERIRLGEYGRRKRELPDAYFEWKKEPTLKNYEAVLQYLSPVVNTAMTSFADGDRTLLTRAHILVGDALRSFDPKAGASLKTHVYNRLKRLRRYRAERARAVHIPENVRLDASAVERYRTEFKDKWGREPSLANISDNLSMSQKRVQKALGRPVETPGTRLLGEKGDVLVQEQRTPDQVWADYVYFDLDEPNKKVFEWVTGYGGSRKLPKKEIAKRLGVSPAAVSSRLQTIQKKMDQVNE